MNANIYDVAREAQVSIATVSRVLNNNPSVSPATKVKVQEALEKLNYQPSGIARGLVTKKMQTVGVLTVDVRSPNYSVTAYTIERSLFMMGYNSILCNTFGGPAGSMKYVQMLLEKGVSGIICLGSVFDRSFNESNLMSEWNKVPFILTNYQVDAENVCCVAIDEKTGINLAVEHLLSLGRRNIVFVKDMDTHSAAIKAAVFKTCLQAHNLPVSRSSIELTDRSLEGGKVAVEHMLNSGTEFDAIIFNDDLTAVGGMKYLQKRGYTVPEDVAVLGYNNTPFARCCTPTLTTIDNMYETVGSLAVALLRDLMESNKAAKTVSVVPRLIVRESTVSRYAGSVQKGTK